LEQFIGYDFKSKGYWIYWPNKKSITVKCNIVFNEKDVYLLNESMVIPGDVLAEVERDKVLQPSLNNPQENNESADSNKSSKNEATTDDAQNSIPFPSTTSAGPVEEPPDDDPNIVQGKCARPTPGTYAHWNKEGLHANTLQMMNEMKKGMYKVVDDSDSLPDWTSLATAFGDEPRSLAEALNTPNGKLHMNTR